MIQRERSCDFPAAVAIASEILSDRYDDRDLIRRASFSPRKNATVPLRCSRRRSRSAARGPRDIWSRRAASFWPICRPILSASCATILIVGLAQSARALFLALFRDIENDRPNDPTHRHRSRSKKSAACRSAPTRNAAIKIYDHAAVTSGLCIAEGLETALSAPTIQYCGTSLAPIWATGGTETMRAFPVLPAIGSLTIIVDHDAINPRPASALVRRPRANARNAGAPPAVKSFG